jgi:hypothetical protein
MKLKLTGQEFGDFVVALLYDKMSNPEMILPPEIAPEFSEFVDILERKGTRSIMLAYWLKMEPKSRIRYRLARPTFDPHKSGQSVWIEVDWEPMPSAAEKQGILKRAGKLLKRFVAGEFEEKKEKK